MGHRIKRKTFVLRFEEGSDLAGATVTARSIPFGDFVDMIGVAAAASLSEDSTAEDILAHVDPGDAAQMGRILGGFADALVDWDLEEEDGTPIPATAEGVRGLDTDVALDLLLPWLDAVQGARRTGPLPNGSGSGATSPAPSLPMEPLSRSPQS